MTNLPDCILRPKSDRPGVIVFPRWYIRLRDANPEEAKFIDEAKVHPEIGFLAIRAYKLIDADSLTSREDQRLRHAVATVLWGSYDFRWWFKALPEGQLLPHPNTGSNPSIEDVRGAKPADESFAAYLDFVQRVWEFLIRLEKKYGLDPEAR